MGKKKDAKRVAAGKRSRAKGKTWERAVVRMLKPLWERAHRGHQDSRGGFGGGEGCDVEGTPFYVECRHEQSYNWRKHLREAMAMRTARHDNRAIVLVAKEDKKPEGWRPGGLGRPPIVVMLLGDWLSLAHELAGYRRAMEKNLPEYAEANCAPWDYLDLILSETLGRIQPPVTGRKEQ